MFGFFTRGNIKMSSCRPVSLNTYNYIAICDEEVCKWTLFENENNQELHKSKKLDCQIDLNLKYHLCVTHLLNVLQTLGSDTGDKKKIWISTCPLRTDSLVILLLQGKTKHEKQTSLQSGWSASCKVVLCLIFLKKHLHSSCSSFSYYLSKLSWTFLLHQKQLWEITQNVGSDSTVMWAAWVPFAFATLSIGFQEKGSLGPEDGCCRV